MWLLLHKLFGWHYVHLKNITDQEIRRVLWTPNGKPYAHYFSDYLIYLDEPNGWKVTALTFEKPKEWP